VNYLRHFGLREAPFGITPDTGFFFSSKNVQEALNTLVVAVANGEGFIKITGEVGTGKTLLCRKFLATLEGTAVTAYIPNPNLHPRALYLALADELDLDAEHIESHRLDKEIMRRLLDSARQGKRVVLCMDETQAMPLETLEALRLLTNLETEKRKLLQVVLFGQPELDRKLTSASVRQLAQRITFQYSMRGLDREETGQYVAHRLSVAGYSGVSPFKRDAVRRIHAASAGIPRLINILSHKAMMLVYGEGGHSIEGRHVKAAILDTPAVRRKRWWQFGFSRGAAH
jgi:MSHA biogenesis protein MshM